MQSALLLPRKYKKIGTVILVLSLALGILVRFWDFQLDFLTLVKNKPGALFDDKINFTDEFALSGIILGLLFIAFAKAKREDEFISRTRLESWQWAVLFNYILLLLATWAVHGVAYIDVMMYNMLTIPIIFIVRFHYVMYKTNSLTEN
ncbi:MAG TPA: hypothetical protein VFN95_13560 [Flavitalea sp.]|nr:hypothetical protein [Flavitalea sp.]